MKTLITTLLILLVSIPVFAAPKILKCEHTDGSKKFQMIFDTDDFSKESPEYEYTLLYIRGGERILFEKSIVVSSGITYGEGYDVGNTYRYTYSVSPTTLSFKYVMVPVNPLGDKSKRTINISRKDLTFDHGTCEMSDYKVKNMH